MGRYKPRTRATDIANFNVFSSILNSCYSYFNQQSELSGPRFVSVSKNGCGWPQRCFITIC